MAVVLLVGEDREHAGGLRLLLRKDGHDVTWIRGTDAWSQTEREKSAELVVAAVEQPHDLLDASPPTRGFAAPLLLVQNVGELFQESYREDRFVDRIESPFTPEEFLARAHQERSAEIEDARRPAGGSPRQQSPAGIGAASPPSSPAAPRVTKPEPYPRSPPAD